MKALYRYLSILLIAVMCFGMLAACGTPETPDNDTPTEDPYDIITIAEALDLCGEAGNLTTERYYLKGVVVSIKDARYGSMTIQDETGTIDVYGTYSADGSIGYADMTDKPYKGDTVLLHCTLQNYNGTKEVKNARLISFEKASTEVNEADYTVMTVAAARDAAEGTKIKVDGVVAQITYANGEKPAGVILADDTQSIYVYDADLAGRVKVGNTVTILASKTYWILDKEQSSAAKFGYKGCCQLEDVTVISVDTSVTNFDRTWIPTSTVKALLETPVTENVTTAIYKVNALVKKAPGSGFTNYYFNDIDGTTGTYTYTQCNGSDFAWLDPFDGKICTVYLTLINAKSSSSGCVWRVLPVAVIDEGYTFDLADTAKHVVEYYGMDQFRPAYTGNPALELATSVSSTLLGFEGATLSYTSSNTDVVYFTEVDGKTVFNCGEVGTATITITGTYNGTTHSETVSVRVNPNVEVETITIKEAQETAVGETVVVRGIVGPSVVNQNGFYLFDETGLISVILNDKALFGEIAIGNEIIITAKRDSFKGTQTCLTGATILANYYGNTPYPETSFITDKTLADIYNLNSSEDHTTEVYVVKATVKFQDFGYYTKLTLTDNDTELTLYSSSASQYTFLKAYDGQEITVEIAPCNWNAKGYYTGCVLAVRTADGKVLNELNFNT